MSLDAIVWLIAGIGVGVGGSLMLLVIYAGFERVRLGQRLRRARLLQSAIQSPEVLTDPAERAAPVEPVAEQVIADVAIVEPEPQPAVAIAGEPAKQLPVAAEAKPESALVEPKAEPKPEPVVIVVEPESASASAPEPQPVAKPVPTLSVVASRSEPLQVEPPAIVEGISPKPASPPPVVAMPVAAEPAPPRPQQSVEEMFAEAFALEKVSVAPLKPKDEKP